MDLESAEAEAVDGGKDVVGGFGPAKGLWLGVVGVDVGVDVGFEGLGRSMDAAADLLLGEQREEALDLVDPGGRGRGEVDVPAGALGEPVADEPGLVAAGIVDDEMDVEIGRHVALDGVEEAAELPGAMAGEALADDLADLHVERGEQRERAMPLVVVGAALGLAGPHRQERLGAVERLDLALLVDARRTTARSGGSR